LLGIGHLPDFASHLLSFLANGSSPDDRARFAFRAGIGPYGLVIPQILTRNNSIHISFANPQLIAGIVAALIAWRTKNVLLTILSGMIVLWVLQILVPGYKKHRFG